MCFLPARSVVARGTRQRGTRGKGFIRSFPPGTVGSGSVRGLLTRSKHIWDKQQLIQDECRRAGMEMRGALRISTLSGVAWRRRSSEPQCSDSGGEGGKRLAWDVGHRSWAASIPRALSSAVHSWSPTPASTRRLSSSAMAPGSPWRARRRSRQAPAGWKPPKTSAVITEREGGRAPAWRHGRCDPIQPGLAFRFHPVACPPLLRS